MVRLQTLEALSSHMRCVFTHLIKACKCHESGNIHCVADRMSVNAFAKKEQMFSYSCTIACFYQETIDITLKEQINDTVLFQYIIQTREMFLFWIMAPGMVHVV